MKKLLSILGAIGLTAISTTTLISCEKPNNHENYEGNKLESLYNPQQPPENSNWKLITDMLKEKNVIINKNVFEDIIVQNGKYYFVVFRLKGNEIPWKIYKLQIGKSNSMPIYSDGLKDIKAFYRWDGVGEPQIPTINPNTGEITDWKE